MFKRAAGSVFRKPILVIGLTLASGAVFKLSAFVREAFIAAHFGLTPLTDTYFSLQQLPLTLATFMFGAFSRAFAPAFADSIKENGGAAWLGGCLFYASVAGVVLTVATLLGAPLLFQLMARPANRDSVRTLVILCASYLPIIWIGFGAALWLGRGRSVESTTLTGVPYLVMTLSLGALYLARAVGDLTLPISMTAGFACVGLFSLVVILGREKPFSRRRLWLAPWAQPEFRRFFNQLGASSVETAAYAASQFTMIYFLARSGSGAISANNCASRVGMLGFSLLAQPLAQFMQSRLCVGSAAERKRLAAHYLLAMGLSTLTLALCLYRARFTVAALVYMRGHFTSGALDEVASILPAWLGYFVVLSMNAVAARYLFTASAGRLYTRYMLFGYVATNALRLITAGRFSAAAVVWCAVAGEGAALVLNVWACLAPRRRTAPAFAVPGPQGFPG